MKEIFESKRLSPIELAKHVMALKPLSDSKKEFKAFKKTIVPRDQIERVNQIIRGLEQEDEFVILCRLMGTCESISKLGQSPVIDNSEKSPDFLVSFHPGCSAQGLSKKDIKGKYNCFVEVKSCKKDSFKISKSDLKARRKFASRFGLPLVFAIRFTLFEGQCYWILIDAKTLERQGPKVKIDQLIGSIGPVLFDDYCIFTHPSLHLLHYYKNDTNLSGIRHGDYGVLVKTFILLPNSKPIELEDNISVLINAVLDCFEFKSTQTETERGVTSAISYIGSQARFLSDMIYRTNNLARDKDGQIVYDPTSIISRFDSKNDKPSLITREMVEWVIRFLNSKELMFFKFGIGDPKEQEKILRALMRRG